MSQSVPADVAIAEDLIFDIGMRRGDDAAFCLAKGFRVLGLEPNPTLAAALEARFASEIASGRLVSKPVGLMPEAGIRPFFVDPADASRGSFTRMSDTPEEQPDATEVECVTLHDLLREHGCPYYLKVNADCAAGVLQALAMEDCRPPFLSLGAVDLALIGALARLGYTMFSLRPQSDKSWASLPDPPREGRFVAHTFTAADSGPFGFEVPDWMSASTAKRRFRETIKSADGDWLAPSGEWFDLHATCWPRALDGPKLSLADLPAAVAVPADATP